MLKRSQEPYMTKEALKAERDLGSTLKNLDEELLFKGFPLKCAYAQVVTIPFRQVPHQV